MGFGTEILFFVGLGVVVLGPKRLHSMIAHVTRARARFDKMTQAFKSQLVEELDPEPRERPKSAVVE